MRRRERKRCGFGSPTEVEPLPCACAGTAFEVDDAPALHAAGCSIHHRASYWTINRPLGVTSGLHAARK